MASTRQVGGAPGERGDRWAGLQAEGILSHRRLPASSVRSQDHKCHQSEVQPGARENSQDVPVTDMLRQHSPAVAGSSTNPWEVTLTLVLAGTLSEP